MATREASIVINGVTLTEAQAMTIRVALGSFEQHLIEDGLGDDDHGRTMVAGYRAAIEAIQAVIFGERATSAPNVDLAVQEAARCLHVLIREHSADATRLHSMHGFVRELCRDLLHAARVETHGGCSLCQW